MDDTHKQRLLFGGSVLAMILGLFLIFDPVFLVGLFGWEEETANAVYVRGLLLVFAGCWFAMRSHRELERLARLREVTGTAPPPRGGDTTVDE